MKYHTELTSTSVMSALCIFTNCFSTLSTLTNISFTYTQLIYHCYYIYYTIFQVTSFQAGFVTIIPALFTDSGASGPRGRPAPLPVTSSQHTGHVSVGGPITAGPRAEETTGNTTSAI